MKDDVELEEFHKNHIKVKLRYRVDEHCIKHLTGS